MPPVAIDIITPVQTVVMSVLLLAAAITEVIALVHSITQRADAYTAAGKLTKQAWVGINLACVLVTIVLGLSPANILGLIAITAALVYLVDVRPALREVTEGGSSSW
ncbi:DUF2516 family protein [Fodinicola acaciae]|uniref:DUF2516 family protein n=1 Tax=Fodinicola acaciae TaxID=2681555 RepID=UPI0013D48076|nr:DUF2516 family protein [Fodinicola acaciae]